jgi:hypothetical protein
MNWETRGEFRFVASEMFVLLEIAAFALPRWLIAAPLRQFLEGGRLHRTAALRALPRLVIFEEQREHFLERDSWIF